MNETEAQQRYQEIFRDYRGKGWTRWEGHFVTTGRSTKSGRRKVALQLERHPHWIGGRVMQEGYIKIKMGNHPRACGGYIGEHTLMAEMELGHFLPPGSMVHHKNEIPTDNRPDNLEVCCNRAQHNRAHREKRALEACGHADWLRCSFCKQYSPESEMRVRLVQKSGYKQGHHSDCLNKYQLEGYYKRKARRLQNVA